MITMSDIYDAKRESIIDTLEWCLKHNKNQIKQRLKEEEKEYYNKNE